MAGSILEQLQRELGDEVVIPGPQVPEAMLQDWAGLPPTRPLALLRPRDTEGVARALALCHAARVGVVPQGGLTGISGGAHPQAGCVSLSLQRLDRIEAVDPEAATLTAGAGVILATAQEAAAAAGMAVGVDIGARASCTLGGVIATNAGGNTVIRYGMAREQVLGLEAVLADGTVIDAMRPLTKDNAGLDLKHLFIGSEGLLGVVTRCILRLHPAPGDSATALCACPDFAAVAGLLRLARGALGPALTSFEAMWPGFQRIMGPAAAAPPFFPPDGIAVIVESSGFGTRDAFEGLVIRAHEAGLVTDAVIAASVRDQRRIWALRESVSEFSRVLGPIVPFDVSLPLRRMDATLATIEAAAARDFPGARALVYGHIGDGNLHVVVALPDPGDHKAETRLKDLVYGLVRDAGGSISAEHGIGAIKRPYLGHSRSPQEIALMRGIKALLDPHGIMNPGRSFAEG
ncbi:FAD-binding oxidoreductase [Paracoccus sp. S-4012]|uniref:FAD-binding oxidoreductase n=1 Tax=Paracoccus sp. S-4012 TaxID=2665648 RepID=UPI001E603059|nr:FAD-binding oxidoreductase [Paracoccus sp. S-4012]